jgi:hypothetical protein
MMKLNSERQTQFLTYHWPRAMIVVSAAAWASLMTLGCTATSTMLAIEGSERSDAVRTAVVERQHRSLKILLFRDTLDRLVLAKSAEEQEAVLNEAWNDRDLIEFWLIQDTLARCLHIATVDAKLASDQSIFQLIVQDISRRAAGPLQAVDEYVAAKLGDAVTDTQPAE